VIFYQQDIPAKESTGLYMFQNLIPNQNYSISVTMRNEVGEGPPQTTYISTTPLESVGTLQKMLIKKPLYEDLTFQYKK